MQELHIGSEPIVLDDDGHLADFDRWSPQVARLLAERDGLGELTEQHFQILEYIRDYYKRFRVAPMLHMLSRDCQISYREFHALFHKQPGKRAAKIAGLSKSSGCV